MRYIFFTVLFTVVFTVVFFAQPVMAGEKTSTEQALLLGVAAGVINGHLYTQPEPMPFMERVRWSLLPVALYSAGGGNAGQFAANLGISAVFVGLSEWLMIDVTGSVDDDLKGCNVSMVWRY